MSAGVAGSRFASDQAVQEGRILDLSIEQVHDPDRGKGCGWSSTPRRSWATLPERAREGDPRSPPPRPVPYREAG